MRVALTLVTLLSSILLSGAATATTTTYFVVANVFGLDQGGACLSTATTCGAEFDFVIPPATFPISGSLTFDDIANTVDFDLTMATATLAGSHDGVSEIVFNNMSYVANGVSVVPAAGQIFDTGGSLVDVTGTYEQTDGVSTVVGPAAVNASSLLSAFTCLLDGVGGNCGLTIGALRDLQLNVGTTAGGESHDFVQTFNFNLVVPEPGTASLLAFGLLTLGFRRSRR